MTLIELKKSLHEKIDGVTDEHLLDEAIALLDNNKKVFIIPEHMKEGILQGEKDIENGVYITMEELESDMKNG